ncbi:ATP-binding protein [Streptomyces sp. NPDC014894]|uniref:ATP-binding protein n=1 Tax=unclassified Streptomyces TaxID=2593676 RepID=UPI0037017C15
MNRDALHAPLMDPCSGVDHHRYGFELPARVEYVSRARKLARDRLRCWGIAGDVHDTAMLVVSELVTNAVVHSGSHLISCELLNGVERLRISVRDQGCAPTGPHVCHTKAAEERGRGLLLVESVSSAWGAHAGRSGSGRTVWAELAHANVPYGADFPAAEHPRAPARPGRAGLPEARRPHTRTEVPQADARRPGLPLGTERSC